MKKKMKKSKGGFDYYRTREQLIEYMKIPAERKLQWLEEMRKLNNLVAKHNPDIAKIQEIFRRGEISNPENQNETNKIPPGTTLHKARSPI